MIRRSRVTIAAIGFCAIAATGRTAVLSLFERPAAGSALVTPTDSTAIDESALAILKKNAAAMFRLKSYQAECWTTITCDPTYPGSDEAQTATLAAAKPNLMHYDSWRDALSVENGKRKSGTPFYTYVSDGKTIWQQVGPTYRKDKATDPKFLSTDGEPWNGFYSPEVSLYASIIQDQKKSIA